MNMTPKRTAILLSLMAIALLLPLSGCSFVRQTISKSPGGNMRSDDSYTYVSTPYEPLTITLYDNRDNEPLWTVDVPVGSKVSIKFRKNKVKEGTTRRPDVMQWVIYDQKKRTARYDNTMAVPPARSRLMRVSLRSGPEFPEEATPEQSFPNPDHQWLPVTPHKHRNDSTSEASSSYSGN